jgi:hypothetical protein
VRRGAGWPVVVLVAAVAVACGEIPNTTSPSAELVGAVDPSVVETHVPFTFAFVNPCLAEPFSGSGFFHFKSLVTTAPKFHTSTEMNFEDTKGFTVTGVRYVVPFDVSAHEIADADFAPANGTTELMEQFIRQAEDGTLVMDDDFYFKLKLHFTVNATGGVTASFTDPRVECR